MVVRWVTAFLDTPRPSASIALDFWTRITGSTLSGRRGSAGQFVTLLPEDGDPYLRVQEIDEGRAGCHVDLHVDDVPASITNAVEYGAVPVGDPEGVARLRSPAGLVFCLVAHHGESARPSAVTSSRGHRTLVDQVCIDVARNRFDDELRFWSSVTGWEACAGALPEFGYLERPPKMPLRLLFQRLHSADLARQAGAHLDLACDDPEAAVAGHVALGASIVRRAQHWVTLTDPAGREYCVTNRDPLTGRLH